MLVSVVHMVDSTCVLKQKPHFIRVDAILIPAASRMEIVLSPAHARHYSHRTLAHVQNLSRQRGRDVMVILLRDWSVTPSLDLRARKVPESVT